MKKLALLLGSLLVVTATQAKEVVVAPVEAEKEVVVVAEPVVEEVAVVEEAVPTLKLTGIKTGLWHENRSGHRSGNLGDNSLRLYLDFAYGEDWTFSTAIRRYFGSNTKDEYNIDGTGEGLFNQRNDKVYLGATRHFDKFNVGYTYITTDGVDTHAFATNIYPTDYFSFYFDYEYNSKANGNGADSDSHYTEFEPKLMWNGWAVSYFFEGDFAIENDSEYYYQQVRLYTPAWTYGNFAVSGEYRGNLSYESKDEKGKDTHGVATRMKDAFDVNRIYAHTTYKLNDATTIFADLGYEIGKWEEKDGSTKDSNMFILETGVKYTF